MITYSAVFLLFAIIMTFVAGCLGGLVYFGNAMTSSPGPIKGRSLFVVPALVALILWLAWAAS